MTRGLILWAYRLVFLGIRFIALPLLALGNVKVRRALQGRCEFSHGASVEGKPLWVHVASAGELEQVLCVLDALQAEGGMPVLLTYFSPSGERATLRELERRAALGLPVPFSGHGYCPWDTRREVTKFLNRYRPRGLVLVSREIWPEALTQLNARGVDALLISVRVTSLKTLATRWFLVWAKKLRWIGTVNRASTESLLSLGFSAVELGGDPRIDRVIARSQSQLVASSSKTLVLASIWPEDFEEIQGGIDLVAQRFPDWKVWVVPHEMDPKFLRTLETWFSKREFSLIRLTEGKAIFEKAQFGLVDTVGRLAELYALASVVFVGGSFRKKVHNVLEPAVYGAAVITGPKNTNSLEAEELRDCGGLKRVASGDEFARVLEGLVSKPSLRQEMGVKARRYVLERAGSSEFYAKKIRQIFQQ